MSRISKLRTLGFVIATLGASSVVRGRSSILLDLSWSVLAGTRGRVDTTSCSNPARRGLSTRPRTSTGCALVVGLSRATGTSVAAIRDVLAGTRHRG